LANANEASQTMSVIASRMTNIAFIAFFISYYYTKPRMTKWIAIFTKPSSKLSYINKISTLSLDLVSKKIG